MTDQGDALSNAGPVSRQLYKELLAAIKPIGSYRAEVKKTSIHLVRNSAFAGVHPRKAYLLLTVKSAKAIRSPRIVKSEQISKNRWHLDLKITAAEEIDAELLNWLRDAYELCA